MPSGRARRIVLLLRGSAHGPRHVWRWFSSLAGYMLLTAPAERLGEKSPRRFRNVWAQLMLLGLLAGVLLSWLWGTAWTVFGDYFGLPLMQVAVVASVMALWLFRRGLLALARCLGGRDERVQNLVATVLIVVLALALLGLRKSYDRDVWLPAVWRWVCPMVAQRVLALTPLWGAWGMLIACQFCKPADDVPPAVAAFAKGCTAPAVALSLVLPLAGTVSYLYLLTYYRNAWQLTVPAVTILGAIAGGVVLSRRTGGLTRRALLANNLLTQLVFIVAYLANR